MKDEIAITLNATEVSAVLGLLYTYFRSPEFGTLTSDEQEMLAVLEEKFVLQFWLKMVRLALWLK